MGNSILFFMMFQPWLKASGWDGKGTINAFGQFTHTTSHLNLWSQAAPPGVKISGSWAIFISVAIFVVVVGAIQAITNRSDLAGGVTAVASVVVAILVLVVILNLDTNLPKVQAAMGMGNDWGPQVGLAISALRGTGSYPWPGHNVPLSTAGLTSWAFSSAGVAFGCAALAVITAWRNGLREILAFIGKFL
ncbi:hypothetical protein [Nocardia sp. NPDC046763]|uniref:hypothetical protein n=1 Tax=Nocardia sp. NPDC046763 TaxID=3155256 RepID=UPI0034095CBF